MCEDKQRRMRHLLKEFKSSCVWCGCHCSPYVAASAPNRATREHLIPVSKDGAEALSNAALSCFRCNNARGSGMEPPDTVRDISTLRALSPGHDRAWATLLGERAAVRRPNPDPWGEHEWAISRKKITETYNCRRVIATSAPGDKPRPQRRRYFDFSAGW